MKFLKALFKPFAMLAFNLQCLLFGHLYDINNVCIRCGKRR